MALEEKKIEYKFYDTDGIFAASLSGSDFVNFPEFSIDINGGISEIKLKSSFGIFDWAYPADGLLTYPYGSDIPEGYTGRTMLWTKGIQRIYDAMFIGYSVKIFIFDKENPEGIQIWSGIYAGCELNFSDGSEKDFIHYFVPNIARLSARILRSGDNTTVQLSSQDPSDIFKYIINNADVGISYNADSIKETGVSRTYEFVAYTCIEALKKSLSLTPQNWMWFIGGNDLLYLQNTETTTIHEISMQKCKNIKFEKTVAFVRNRVLFLGGGSPQLFKKYDAVSSQNVFGLYEEKISDERVTDANTAQILSERFLKENQVAVNYFVLEVMDSNYSANGYDIEAIKPGDKILIHSNTSLDFAYSIWGGFFWGATQWKYDFYSFCGIPGIVKKIMYKFTSAVIECSFNFDKQQERIEDINRDLTNYRFKDAPDAPTA